MDLEYVPAVSPGQQRIEEIYQMTSSTLSSTSVVSNTKLPTVRPQRRKSSKSETPLLLPLDDREIVKLSFFYSFIQVYVPDRERTGVREGRSSVSWVLIMPDLLRPDDLFFRALTTLGMARMGRQDQDVALAMQAGSPYGKALCKLQTAPNTQSLVYREETLTACLALATFEVGHRINKFEYLNHLHERHTSS